MLHYLHITHEIRYHSFPPSKIELGFLNFPWYMPTGKTICTKSGMLTKEINIGHKVDLEFLVMGKPSILILSCIK